MGVRKLITAAVVSVVFLAWGVLAAQSTSQNPGGSASESTLRLERCQTSWADTRIIASKIPGKIDRRLVDDGKEVNDGDILAVLDARDAELELAIQEILGNSELDEKGQQKKLQEYIARFDSASRLVGSRAISEEEYRLARVNVEVNELLTLKEAEKRTVEQKKAERARVFVDDHVIRSPMHGMIRKCFKREKESVSNSDLQMFEIVSTDKVWVEGPAHVSDLFRIKIGQPVEVKLAISDINRNGVEDRKGPLSPGLRSSAEAERPATPRSELPQEKITFRGKIVYIDPNADGSGGVFRVRAEVENQSDPDTGMIVLRAGLNTTMKIDLSKQPASKGDEKN